MILSENEKIAPLFDSGICRAGIEGISFCYISPTGLAADTTTGSVSDEPAAAAAAAASHENHQSSAYGDVVVNLFEEIQQQQQEKEEGQKISIDLLAQATVEKGNASFIKSTLDQYNIENTLNLISLLAEKNAKKKVGKKRSAFCASNYDSGATVIDMTLIDQIEMEQERSKKMTRFSAFQNFYRFGDPLPVTEDVIRVLQEQEKLSSEETYHDRCARGGFQ